MHNGIVLRPATFDDLEWLDELHTRCMRELVNQLYEWRPEQFRTTFDPLINHIIVVDGADAGLLSYWNEPDALRVGNLLVEPALQGRGIGTEVMRRLLASAEAELRIVRLRVLRNNRARSLYERLGFLIEAETDHGCIMTKTSF
jgi:ribosomal protein S18 acetylase RimI-like enzyme